jgi:hypothetical protein
MYNFNQFTTKHLVGAAASIKAIGIPEELAAFYAAVVAELKARSASYY